MAREDSQDSLKIEGKVVECLPNMMYRVELPNGHRLLAHVPGKMRARCIPVLPGEKVMLEISPYDLSVGRINCRQK